MERPAPYDRIWRKCCFEGFVVIAADPGFVYGVQKRSFCDAQGRWYSRKVQPYGSVGQRQQVGADFAVVSINDPTVGGTCDLVNDDFYRFVAISFHPVWQPGYGIKLDHRQSCEGAEGATK